MSIILSLIFFLTGNILIPATHLLFEHHHEHHHEHDHEHHNEESDDTSHECSQCIMIENSIDFDININSIHSLIAFIIDDVHTNLFFIRLNFIQVFSSRAPPYIS
tara:strand:- start:510 stop:824 length:315 start_codon:yes stop_codon:yes gene_type:complete